MLTQADARLRVVTLEDKYALESGRVYLSGVQALVRLLIEQRRRDQRSGLRTAGFVSGYRGSPLGGVDLELWRAASVLAGEHIHFEPGLNEELAATMVQGSQQIGIIGQARYDGVFGLWYGKNPGLDRAADALKHCNAAGTARLGGAIAVSGDDPAASSSSIPNQSDHAFMSASMPTLAPADIAEVIEYGLLGYALSRYAGVWVGMKTVADVVEGSASVAVRPDHPAIVLPARGGLPARGDLSEGGGLPEGAVLSERARLSERAGMPVDAIGMRWPDSRWEQDARLLNVRIPAALAFARANRLDRVCFGATRQPRLGLVTSGKASGDVRQALAELGIDQALAEALGLAVYKVAMSWPLEPVALRDFAHGLEEVLVVEERRAVIEPQIKEQAYHWPQHQRPRVVGKSDETGAPLLPQDGVLTPLQVAQVLGRRLAAFGLPEGVRLRLAGVEARLAGGGGGSAGGGVGPAGDGVGPAGDGVGSAGDGVGPASSVVGSAGGEGRFSGGEARLAGCEIESAGGEVESVVAPLSGAIAPARTPHFCAGCPHARSTQVPDGSLAMAGIGCHSLRLGMPDSRTLFMVQMGGEGSNWLGAAPFVDIGHVFQNLGDGTYGHSGSLAIRAAVAARRSITFRILYNGIVAMTGGQPAEGALTIGQISHQLLAEGVRRVVVVAEDPKARSRETGLASDVAVRHRDELDLVQRELRAIPGVTAIIYDQLCAIEKRRQRKRGERAAISERVFINERVCEGCGDCSAQSQCAAIMPVATPLGNKRRIDQSACNADLSCLRGFCPSFVVIEGGRLRKPGLTDLREPERPEVGEANEAGLRRSERPEAGEPDVPDPRKPELHEHEASEVPDPRRPKLTGQGEWDESDLHKPELHEYGASEVFDQRESELHKVGEPAVPDLDESELPEPGEPELPLPAMASIEQAGNIIVSGIGGTGVVTVGAILGMAAHLQGYGCSVLDNTGIARKGGAVSIHVRLAPRPEDLASTRIVDGAATLLLAADLVVAAEPATLAKIGFGTTHVVANTDAVPTLNQRLDPDGNFDAAPLLRALERAAGTSAVHAIPASDIALRTMGDTIFCNMLMLGHAWQLGHIPLTLSAMQRAIEINGNAVQANLRAFALGAGWGQVLRFAPPGGQNAGPDPSLDELVAQRSAMLADYQNAAYVRRYAELVQRARAAQARAGIAGDALARAVAEGHFRLLAVKDEYEVARLHSDGVFRREIEQQFEGPYRVRYHLAPPLFARRNRHNGQLEKRSYGAWMGWLFVVLAKLKPLRGTPFDPFGYTQERRDERRLLLEYERDLGRMLDALTPENHALVLEFAQLPLRMRGYGHVKERNVAAARKRGEEILFAMGSGLALCPPSMSCLSETGVMGSGPAFCPPSGSLRSETRKGGQKAGPDPIADPIADQPP